MEDDVDDDDGFDDEDIDVGVGTTALLTIAEKQR